MELKMLIDRYQNAINKVYRSINQILKEKMHSDITTDQFSTLQYIRHHEYCTSTQIAQAFGIGKSAVTAQINRLVKKEFIKRIRDKQDRRNVFLYVTDRGQHVIESTEQVLYQVIGNKLSHFDEREIESFIHSLEKLADLMED